MAAIFVQVPQSRDTATASRCSSANAACRAAGAWPATSDRKPGASPSLSAASRAPHPPHSFASARCSRRTPVPPTCAARCYSQTGTARLPTAGCPIPAACVAIATGRPACPALPLSAGLLPRPHPGPPSSLPAFPATLPRLRSPHPTTRPAHFLPPETRYFAQPQAPGSLYVVRV